MKTKAFLTAFNLTMEREGWSSNDPADPGGETYRGISRVFWPRWPGWVILERISIDQTPTDKSLLQSSVENFYLENFWDKIQGENIASISQEIANEVFDTSVNMGLSKGSSILQDALNLLNNNQRLFPDLIPDGEIGKETIHTLSLYVDLRPPTKTVAIARLLRVMNCLQGERYLNLMRKHPDREKFRGWFDRI